MLTTIDDNDDYSDDNSDDDDGKSVCRFNFHLFFFLDTAIKMEHNGCNFVISPLPKCNLHLRMDSTLAHGLTHRIPPKIICVDQNDNERDRRWNEKPKPEFVVFVSI